MSSLYAEDIVNLNPDGTTNVGKEACLEKDKGWDSAFSDFKFDVVNSMESLEIPQLLKFKSLVQ